MYHYAPPRRRAQGGGAAAVWGVFALGFVAMVFVGGAVLLRMVAGDQTSGPGGSVATGGGSGRSSSSGSSGSAPAGRADADRLYRVGPLPGDGCTGRQIAPGSSASFSAFLNGTADCLDRSWSAAFSRAGLTFSPPRRVFWSTPGRSPCGDYPAPGAAAFYCSLNNAIYIGVAGHVQQAAGNLPVTYNVAYARNLAHEYAHHVQDRSGILARSQELRSSAGSTEARNAITRRTELQAQCFAGAFMAAVRQTYPVTQQQWSVALRDSYGRGDDPSQPATRDHGTGGHYAGWLNRGYSRGSPAVCDTWDAPASQVS